MTENIISVLDLSRRIGTFNKNLCMMALETCRTKAVVFFLFFHFFCYHAYSQNAVDDLKKIASEYPDSSQLYLQIAKKYIFNTPDSAYHYIREALESAEQANDVNVRAEGYKFLGIWHDLQSSYDSSIHYYSIAGRIYQESGQSEGYGDILNNIAYTKTKESKYEEALTDYYKALDIYKQEGALSKASRTQINIGIVFQQTDDLDKALKMYQSAVDNSSGEDGHQTYVTATSNIATIHTRRGEFEKAIPIYDTLVTALKLQNNDRGLSLIYNNLAQAYVEIQEYDQAEVNYTKSIAIKRRMKDRQGLANAYKNLAELYLKTENFPKAKNSIDSSLLISGELKDLPLFTDGKKVVSLISLKSGQHKAASDFFMEYLVLRDSLDVVEQTKVVQELSKKYETEQQEKRIVELELDKKTSALALVSSQYQRNAFIFGFITLLILAGFLFYSYSVKKKNTELLTSKNNQISMALEERETLLREIHHRVKNNLQIISSLLNLQAGSLIDEAAIDAVKEGQNRVKSMALIHQKLYSTDDVRGVDVQDYIENLSSELFSAFGVDNGKIQYQVDTSGLKLDIDTVIPLGLIINELITNTLKYAFEKSQSGLLQVHMKEAEGKLCVMVKDNGKGIDEELMQNTSSFGWKMIKSLSRKLKAEIEIINENGTAVYLTLARYKLVV